MCVSCTACTVEKLVSLLQEPAAYEYSYNNTDVTYTYPSGLAMAPIPTTSAVLQEKKKWYDI